MYHKYTEIGTVYRDVSRSFMSTIPLFLCDYFYSVSLSSAVHRINPRSYEPSIHMRWLLTRTTTACLSTKEIFSFSSTSQLYNHFFLRVTYHNYTVEPSSTGREDACTNERLPQSEWDSHTYVHTSACMLELMTTI